MNFSEIVALDMAENQEKVLNQITELKTSYNKSNDLIETMIDKVESIERTTENKSEKFINTQNSIEDKLKELTIILQNQSDKLNAFQSSIEHKLKELEKTLEDKISTFSSKIDSLNKNELIVESESSKKSLDKVLKDKILKESTIDSIQKSPNLKEESEDWFMHNAQHSKKNDNDFGLTKTGHRGYLIHQAGNFTSNNYEKTCYICGKEYTTSNSEDYQCQQCHKKSDKRCHRCGQKFNHPDSTRSFCGSCRY